MYGKTHLQKRDSRQLMLYYAQNCKAHESLTDPSMRRKGFAARSATGECLHQPQLQQGSNRARGCLLVWICVGLQRHQQLCSRFQPPQKTPESPPGGGWRGLNKRQLALAAGPDLSGSREAEALCTRELYPFHKGANAPFQQHSNSKKRPEQKYFM